MSSTKPLLVYILCYAGRFGTPGSVLWTVRSANEVTPCTDSLVAHRASSGATTILSQLLVESVPLNTVKLPTR